MAGRHNIAFTGPPGVGKTLLARAAAGLLPPLDESEAAEVSRIHSVAGVGHRPLSLTPAVSRPASHDLDTGAGRGRPAGPARRGEPRASRRAAPRRDPPVPGGRARRAARSDRHRLGAHRPGQRRPRAARALHAACRVQPVSVRLARGRPSRLRLRRLGASALPGPPVGADARSDRPRAPPRAGRADARLGAGAFRGGGQAQSVPRGAARSSARDSRTPSSPRSGSVPRPGSIRRLARPARPARSPDGPVTAAHPSRRSRGAHDRRSAGRGRGRDR